MKTNRRQIYVGEILLAFAGLATAGAATAATVGGVECQTPPPQHCAAECAAALLADLGNATEPRTGRKFFLDYPCDLKPNEQVIFILSIHGGGSIGNWQRHYFPAMDYKEKYRLVIATPTAANSEAILPGQPPVRLWTPNGDDEYLHDIVDFVFAPRGPARRRCSSTRNVAKKRSWPTSFAWTKGTPKASSPK